MQARLEKEFEARIERGTAGLSPGLRSSVENSPALEPVDAIPSSGQPRRRRRRGEINIRIIDFAHCTTGDMERARFPPHDPVGPDSGYLWGLQRLSESFYEIWEEERRERIVGGGADVGELRVEDEGVFGEMFGEEEGQVGYISQ